MLWQGTTSALPHSSDSLKHYRARYSTLRTAHCSAVHARTSVPTVPVIFEVARQVAYGEHLKVVGSHPSLGCWEVGQAQGLAWNEGHVWKATITVPTELELEYKFVHITHEGTPVWESVPNRSLLAPAGCTALAINAQWDIPSAHVTMDSSMQLSNDGDNGSTEASIELDDEAVELLEALTSDCQHTSAVDKSSTPQTAATGPYAQDAALSEPQEQQRPWWHTPLPLGQLSTSQQQLGGPLVAAWDSLTGMLAKRSQAPRTAAAATLPGSHSLGLAGLPTVAEENSASMPEANQGWRAEQWQQLEAVKAEMALVRRRMSEIDSLLERATSHQAGQQQP